MNKIDGKNYQFVKLPQSEEYRYSAFQTYDKHKITLYHQSYSSEAKELRKKTLEQLKRHKETIDFAIKYVANQMKRGFGHGLIVFPSNLRKEYRWYVEQYARSQLKLDKTKAGTKGSQKYWVPNCCIETYGFRDKDRKSMFQCFVEFKSAFRDEPDTIKLDLRMSKKAYEHRHLFYLGGFDLVYRQDSIYVRHVSEKLVQQKPDNGIIKYMLIDSWLNVHTATVDKNNCVNEDKQTVTYKSRRTKNSTFMRKVLQKVKNCYDKDKFYENMLAIENSIRQRVDKLVNDSDECEIIVCLPENNPVQSKLYSKITECFLDALSDRCQMHGIKLSMNRFDLNDIRRVIPEYRRLANGHALGKKLPYSNKELKSHLRWSEMLMGILMRRFYMYFPTLQTDCEFTEKSVKSTGANDHRVVSVAKPDYFTFDEYAAQYGKYHHGTLSEIRQEWISIVKMKAQVYYEEYKDCLRKLNKSTLTEEELYAIDSPVSSVNDENDWI